MRVLIIEDESRAANHLERELKKAAPEARVLDKLESVEEAVEWLREHSAPDLVFSDIQLADGLSFEIYAQVELACPIVFTTAYDQYAIEAFRTNGVDYLLQPVSEERIREALAKVARLKPQISMAELAQLLQRPASPAAREFKSRFMIRVGEEIKSIPVREARAFFSQEKATFLLSGTGRRYVLDLSMDQVESQLDPEAWFRVNRKYLVRFQSWSHIYAWTNSRMKIVLPGLDDQEIIVARDRVPAFKNWLDR
ncbi:MAG: LytTR family DNA-binding domain-containing protein [Bacteroidota bacterium]